MSAAAGSWLSAFVRQVIVGAMCVALFVLFIADRLAAAVRESNA